MLRTPRKKPRRPAKIESLEARLVPADLLGYGIVAPSLTTSDVGDPTPTTSVGLPTSFLGDAQAAGPFTLLSSVVDPSPVTPVGGELWVSLPPGGVPTTPTPSDPGGGLPLPTPIPTPAQDDPPAVVATMPADAAILDRAPSTITVVFDRPLQEARLHGGDVVVLRVGDGGTPTPVFEPDTLAEWLDPTGTRLTLTLPGTLPAGRYRLVVPAGVTLSGSFGTPLDTGTDGLRLAEFIVVGDRVDLGTATDIGIPTSTPLTVAGQLDLAGRPDELRLYKLTLPAGRDWRLGLEIDAYRNGSTLHAGLALFDAQGRLISATNQGRPDVPNDPYLFAGLAPGTYYVGVSAATNLPGQPGGYDPATGEPGSAAADQAGGPFALRVVADPIVAPTRLIAAGLDRADPQASTPTGLTLKFSGPLGLSGSYLFGQLSGGIEVVDASGRSWPVAAVGFDETAAQVSYLFRRQLAPGHYTVRLAAADGLHDLAGRAVVANGQPAGVLWSFDVGPSQPAADPNNLGPWFPDAALAGVRRDFLLQPGQTIRIRNIITYADPYTMEFLHDGGPVSIRLIHDGQAVAVDPGANGVDQRAVVRLERGESIVELKAVGNQPVVFRLTFSIAAFSWESLLDNGLGQGPALNLRLIDPTAAAAPPTPSLPPTPSPSPTPSPGGVPASGPAAGSTSAAGASGHAPGSFQPQADPSSSGLFAGVLPTSTGELVGRPSADASHVAVVGPGEGASLAANQALPPSTLFSLAGSTAVEALAPPDGEAPKPGTDGTNIARAEPTGEAEAPPPAVDPAAWFERVRLALRDLVGPSPSATPSTLPAIPGDSALDPAAMIALAEADPGAVEEDEPAETPYEAANLAPTLGVALVATLTCGARRAARRRNSGRLPAGPLQWTRRREGGRPA